MNRHERRAATARGAQRHGATASVPDEYPTLRALPPAAIQAILDLSLDFEHLGRPDAVVYVDAVSGRATLLAASLASAHGGVIGAAVEAAAEAARSGGPAGEPAIPLVIVGPAGVEIGLLGECETAHGTVSRFRGAA